MLGLLITFYPTLAAPGATLLAAKTGNLMNQTRRTAIVPHFELCGTARSRCRRINVRLSSVRRIRLRNRQLGIE
jgi:hypothetical protein